MTESEFMKPWVMLLSQPYAKDYTFDPAKESVQRSLYSKALRQVPGDHWFAVVEWWLLNESRWPLPADVRFHLGRMFPPPKGEPLTKRALLAAPTDPSAEPWQSIVQTWIASTGASIYAIGVPILHRYLTKNPHDLVIRERLSAWEQVLNGDQEHVDYEEGSFC